MTRESGNLRHWLPESAAFARMDAYRAIRVSGPDAEALLQGQFSNDISTLHTNPGQLSSYNSPKGRVLAFLRVLRHADAWWLVVDAGILDVFLQRLRMFVLRSKVSIEPAPEIAGLAVTGPAAAARLHVAGLPAPGPGEAVVHDGCVFLGVPGPLPRVEIHGPVEALPELKMEQASSADLARWDILCGLPRIVEGNRDAHVAQHINLDELGAISFRKGCYTGQEIIARMKYLGKIKKRMMVLAGHDAHVGDTIRTADDRSAGEVVNVADADDGQLILAVVNLDDQDSLLNVNGNALSILRP